MGTRLLGDWLEAYERYTYNSEPPTLFKKWIGISVIASALQRKCRLEWGTITFFPNLYIVLVAPSGKCRKGTAMGPGYKMIRDLGIKVAAESITREALIRELAGCEATHGDPTGKRISIHCSLTIFSQELTVFLGYNNATLMADLTDWYDCKEDWTYRTKNSGENVINGVWVNLIGATTPDLIQTTLPRDAIGGGLTSRIIFVFEDRKSKIVPAPFLSPEEEQLREKLKLDLEQINMLLGDFKITDKFLELWTSWYVAQEDNPPFKSNQFAGYFERRPNHIMKLSMIMNASRTSDMILTEVDLQRAIDLLNETERKMPRTFSGVGRNSMTDIVNKTMAKIGADKTVPFSELMQMFYHDANKEELEGVVNTLVSMEFCTREYVNGSVFVKYRPKEEKK